MNTFTTKQHDTRTALKAIHKDSTGTPVNLTGATVKFLMKSAAGVVKVNRLAEIHNAVGGEVWVVWQASEVDTTGVYRGEFEVTYADGKIETFPNSGYIVINIEPDLG